MKALVFILILSMLIYYSGLSAQKSGNTFEKGIHSTYPYDSVISFFSKQIELNYTKYIDLCSISISFAKFIITKEGKIGKLSYSKNLPVPLKEQFVNALIATERLWPRHKTEKTFVDSEWYLLPLIYGIEENCPGYDNIFVTPTYQSFSWGFKFEFLEPDKEIKCTLLTPILVLIRKGTISVSKLY